MGEKIFGEGAETGGVEERAERDVGAEVIERIDIEEEGWVFDEEAGQSVEVGATRRGEFAADR